MHIELQNKDCNEGSQIGRPGSRAEVSAETARAFPGGRSTGSEPATVKKRADIADGAMHAARAIMLIIIMILAVPALQAAGPDTCMNHWETIIYPDTVWRYVTDSAFQEQDWKLISYNDTAWNEGKGGIGYGDNDDATVIDASKVLYLRTKFSVDDTALICQAMLSIDYDDGFVAWLNGAEIARSSVSGEFPGPDSPVELHEAAMYGGGHPENFIIEKDSLAKYLLPGENQLAIQVHNQSLSSSDLTSIIYFSVGVSTSEQLYGPLAEEINMPISPFTGFDIPLMIIETNGQSITRGPKITADMKIIHHGDTLLNYMSDSGNIYTGKIGIEIRGSSSSGFPQKAYSFETRDTLGENRNVPILGMPEENDWLLISNYYDRSFLRNFLSHHIFRGMGHYSPRTRHVEVIVNGEYRGIYLLTERIKADKNRVDIAKLGPYENAGDDVTGGYIIKNDNFRSDLKDSWSIPFPAIEALDWTAVNARLVYVYPDWDTITEQQKAYIQAFITTAKNVLYSDHFNDPINGYYSYFDVASFIDYMIISEVSRNGDAYKKSRFFFKDKYSKDGLLHAGPPWDFDWAWKNLFFQPDDGSGWVHYYEAYGYGDVQPVRFMNQMMQDVYFSNEIYNRFLALRQTVLHDDTLMHTIDSVVNYLSNAQVRHFEQWDVLHGDTGDPDSHVPESYADEISYLKGWILERLAWLDDHIDKFNITEEPSLVQQEPADLFFRVFPNPAIAQVYIESNEPLQKVELMTAGGNLLRSDQLSGSKSHEADLSGLSPGLYILRITIGNRPYTRKIMKM